MANCFGPYKLIRRLAAGGMGEVFLAVLEREGGFQKTVALKTMLPQGENDPDFALRFEAEATMAARLNHANIAQVFDHGSIDGQSYITMEYVEGPDLATLLKGAQPPFPEAVAVEICVQACRGLSHAHTRVDIQGREVGIVHGDISPSNLLLSREGQVKLVDFGLASLRSAGAADGSVIGKYSYMSPEQAAGQRLDPKSDVFSLGLILYEMLCAQRAYPLGESPSTTLAAIRQGQHVPASEARPDLSPQLAQLLDKVLMLSPGDRHSSAQALGRELEEACPACGPDALQSFLKRTMPDSEAQLPHMPEPTEVAQRPLSPSPDGDQGIQAPSRKRGLAWLMGLMLICWTAGFGWWFLHAQAAPRPLPPAQGQPKPPQAVQASLQPQESKAIPTPQDPGSQEPEPGKPALAEPGPKEPRLTITRPDLPKPRPTKALLSATGPAGYRVEMNHRPQAGRSWSLRAKRAHLVKLISQTAGGPELLLRLTPARQPGSWLLSLRSQPWLRIELDGKSFGQTPRSGILLGPGKRQLLFRRAEQSLELNIRIADEAPKP